LALRFCYVWGVNYLKSVGATMWINIFLKSNYL
jgi:hypothetical protein